MEERVRRWSRAPALQHCSHPGLGEASPTLVFDTDRREKEQWMDVVASTFPPGSASPSRADKKPQEAAEGFQPAFDSFFIHFSSSLWLLQSKYILWSLRESFKRNKIHELITLPKLCFFFRPWSLLSEASFWKFLFPTFHSLMQIWRLFIYLSLPEQYQLQEVLLSDHFLWTM